MKGLQVGHCSCHGFALFALLFIASSPGYGQTWPIPGKPIRIVTVGGAGSAPDITTRQLAQKLGASLGVPVLTDNRPGGDGAVAMPEAARGAPDGHTLFMGSSNTHVLNDLVDPNRPFKAHTAFVPVTRVASAPIVLLAGPAFAANGVQELLDRARARPGDLRYATSGLLTRLFGEMIKLAAHVDMLEVRYKSQSDELPNLLSGQIDLSVSFVSVALAHIKSGKLKPLAIASRQRYGGLPDVPTFIEAGYPGVEATGWIGIFAPVQTPATTVTALHRAIADALQSADIREDYVRTGTEPGGESPEQFAAYIQADIERWGKVLRERGLKP